MALDRKIFDQTFNRLAVALRDNRNDTAAKEVYYRALEEFPSQFVSEAALILAKEPERKFFPTTGEWVAAILTVKQSSERKFLARPDNRDEPWHFECTACSDTGWEDHACEGTTEFAQETACGRKKPHYPHNFVTVCPCRATNRTYQRNNIREQKRAKG